MRLDILSCGNVEDAISILHCDLGQPPHLAGKYSAGREANSQHECSRFPLFINPHRYSKSLEVSCRHFSCLELFRHLPEFFKVLCQTVRQMVNGLRLCVSIHRLFSHLTLHASIRCNSNIRCGLPGLRGNQSLRNPGLYRLNENSIRSAKLIVERFSPWGHDNTAAFAGTPGSQILRGRV